MFVVGFRAHRPLAEKSMPVTLAGEGWYVCGEKLELGRSPFCSPVLLAPAFCLLLLYTGAMTTIFAPFYLQQGPAPGMPVGLFSFPRWHWLSSWASTHTLGENGLSLICFEMSSRAKEALLFSADFRFNYTQQQQQQQFLSSSSSRQGVRSEFTAVSLTAVWIARP